MYSLHCWVQWHSQLQWAALRYRSEQCGHGLNTLNALCTVHHRGMHGIFDTVNSTVAVCNVLFLCTGKGNLTPYNLECTVQCTVRGLRGVHCLLCTVQCAVFCDVGLRRICKIQRVTVFYTAVFQDKKKYHFILCIKCRFSLKCCGAIMLWE